MTSSFFTPAAPPFDPVPLSDSQHGLLVAESVSGGRHPNHLTTGIWLDGPLDTGALLSAWKTVTFLHPALRAAVVDGPDGPQLVPATDGPEITTEPMAIGTIADRISQPFPLARGPLARCHLLIQSPQRALVLIVAHHLIVDGTSRDIILDDLAAAYRDALTGRAPSAQPRPLPVARPAPPDLVAEAARLWEAERPLPGELVLPGMASGVGVAGTGRGWTVDFPPAVDRVVREAAIRWGCTVYDVLVAGMSALVHHYGSPDPVLTVPLSVRSSSRSSQVGHLVNELPFRPPAPAGSFQSHVAGIADGLRRLYRVRSVSLARAVPGQRPTGAWTPLVFGYRRSRPVPDFFPLAADVDRIVHSGSARTALELQLIDGGPPAYGGTGLTMALTAAAAAFPDSDADRIGRDLIELLAEKLRASSRFHLAPRSAGATPTVAADGLIVAAPPGELRPAGPVLFPGDGAPVESPQLAEGSLSIGSAAVGETATTRQGRPLGGEAEQRSEPPAAGPAPGPTGGSPKAETVLGLLTEQVRQRPGAIALIEGDRSLTYGQLGQAVLTTADRLRASGVAAGDRVVVAAGHRLETVVVLLACMATRAGYVPIDPTHPAARRNLIMSDADPTLVITESASDGGSEVGDLVVLDGGECAPADLEQLAGTIRPGDIAYLMYTSGSTGAPKGVAVHHGALHNLVSSFAHRLDLGPGDRWLALTTLSFDISGLELYGPLATGGTAVLPGEIRASDGRAVIDLARSRSVTHVQATPSGWWILLESGFGSPDPEPVVALAGGEALPLPLARDLAGRVDQLYNVYGPTETTIWSTLDEVPPGVEEVTIGLPIAKTRVHIVDEELRPVPNGSPGELAIAGDGVAVGYHRQPSLTAERFVPEPGGGGARMYLTGDQVRRLDDGRLVFLGRGDDQVKVRGHRIEIGEIEARLLTHPSVAEGAVSVEGDGPDQQLVAWVVWREEAVAPTEMRSHLAAAVPTAMIPTSWRSLDRLPRTPNGKLDRRALVDSPGPEPVRAGPEPGPEDEAPSGPEPGPEDEASSGGEPDLGDVESSGGEPGPEDEASSGGEPGLGDVESSGGEPGPEDVASSGGAPDRIDDVVSAMVEIWADVLEAPDLQPDDDLFDLGGHSLTITRINARVFQRFGVTIPLDAYFDTPTPGDIASLVAQAGVPV
jgi:amino acid adenylation domain-containing protein